MCIRNGAARVVVEMRLNVAADDTSQRADQVVHLARCSTAHRVCHADAVHANLIDGLVKREKVDKVGPEGVL